MRRRLRFLAVLVVPALVLALVATSLASTTAYKGAFATAGKVSFDIVKRNGEKKVANFRWVGVPIKCEEGSTTFGGQLTHKISVKDGAFDYTADNFEGGVVTIEGQLGSHGAKVTGTMEARGDMNTHVGFFHQCALDGTSWDASIWDDE